MRLIDKIALNRTLSIVFSFILAIVKFFAPSLDKEIDKNNPVPPIPKPPLRKRIPRPWKKSDE
jgi:hypothetical protein